MNTGEIEWPEAEAFQPLVKRLMKPKAAKAPVTVSVSEKGIVTLSLAPEVQQAFLSRTLKPNELQPVHVAFVADDERVALRISGGGGGAYTVRGAMKANSTGTPQRASLPLGKCGGVEFVSRAATDVMHKFGGGDLFVAVPIYVDAGEDAGDGGDDEGGAKSSPPPVAEEEEPVVLMTKMTDCALQAAARAFTPAMEEDAKPVRIAAAVALVEFGCDADDVREALRLSGFILHGRDELQPAAAKAATAALDALEAL